MKALYYVSPRIGIFYSCKSQRNSHSFDIIINMVKLNESVLLSIGIHIYKVDLKYLQSWSEIFTHI